MGMEEMDDDLFYDSYQLVSDLPDRDLLEQLAEESAVHDWRKLVRWGERIQEAKEEKEAANGDAKR